MEMLRDNTCLFFISGFSRQFSETKELLFRQGDDRQKRRGNNYMHNVYIFLLFHVSFACYTTIYERYLIIKKWLKIEKISSQLFFFLHNTTLTI